ncbi:L,D-transpeptidase family protein [Amycolatopsis magusensis]|uniref:L,D-transpeptidase family protein n=1 Tax=Amycolatopsis magusensis TaxID=882444 RepID=UPI00378D57D6
MRDLRWYLPLLAVLLAGCAAVEAEPAPPPPPPPPVVLAPPEPPIPPLPAVQQTLRILGYLVGESDDETKHAVTAFQKVHELPRTGVVDRATANALREPISPSPRGSGPGFEVDLAKQVLYRVENGRVVRIHDASTGRDEPGKQTPTGEFRVQYQIDGWRYAKLGPMYRPSYITNTGIALHGGEPVESHPASNGCVRLTDQAIDEIFADLERGTAVSIY